METLICRKEFDCCKSHKNLWLLFFETDKKIVKKKRKNIDKLLWIRYNGKAG